MDKMRFCFFKIDYFCAKHFTMEYSAFINIDLLSQEARKELETFYEFLLFKNKKQKVKEIEPQEKRFANFLSNTIKADHFVMPNREERNER